MTLWIFGLGAMMLGLPLALAIVLICSGIKQKPINRKGHSIER